jgi:hypothetical protein
MSYRNKTYIAFASEDIRSYNMMKAWRDSEHIEFDFIDAHDINTALDTSQRETIERRLRERLVNTKQAIVLISDVTAGKASRLSFLQYEIDVIARLGLPVVFANLNGVRTGQISKMPTKLKAPYYTMSVSFQPKIIEYALDEYVPEFYRNMTKKGPHEYKAHVYKELGL